MKTPSALNLPLDDRTFSIFVETNRFAVVHFWASWNGWDYMMGKVLDSEIPDELRKNIAFGQFEADPEEHHEICRKYKVLNLPHLEFYRDGNSIQTLIGMATPHVLVQALRGLLGN